MSECMEQQTEEREALQSIYEGDQAFKEVNPTTFQYKYGEEDNYKSFLIEIKWGDNYPNDMPDINMDTFYNRNLIPAVKKKIHDTIVEEGQNWLGCSMTYTLFECIKDHFEEITAEQPESSISSQFLDTSSMAIKITDANDASKKKEPKKEQLSKSQKRRQWERTDHKGERPRGWNWVDIVKHLSQTGHKNNNNDQSEFSSGLQQQLVLEPLNG